VDASYAFMKCPVCKNEELRAVRLELGLSAFTCDSCGGNWIPSLQYWNWLEQHGPTMPEKPAEGAAVVVSDRQQAKLCPDCQRIMLRYKVGHGLGFYVEQCGSCNGIWLDKQEWEALRGRNLHDEIHLIFTEPWQTEARLEEARERLDAIYAKQFGDEYEEVKRIRRWLENHPNRQKVLAFLSDADPYKA
jgi:Zn-finger nucleic acid-binding protein